MASIDNDRSRPGASSRPAGWQPALLLIFAQLAAGLRDMPQFAFFLIYLQEQLVLPPVTISTVVAGAQIASMISALGSGALTARLGSKWVLVGGLALSGLSSLVFQLPAFWVVTLLWLIGGAGAALVTVGTSSYLTRLSGQGTLGILAAFYALSMTVGGAIGNPIAGLLIEQSGFSRFGWTMLALTITTTLILVLWMPNLHDYAAKPVGLRAFGSSLLPTLRQPTVRFLIGLRGLPTLFYGMMTVLVPLLLNELTGNKVMIAAYGTATLIVASFAQLLAGRAADRWGAQRPTLIAYGTLFVAGCGLFLGVGRIGTLFFFGVLGIAAAWSLSTLMYVWVADGLPKDEHPATFGLLHAVWSLCMIGGSLLGGWLVRLTPGLPFLLGGLLNVGACFLVIGYYRRQATANAAQPVTAGS